MIRHARANQFHVQPALVAAWAACLCVSLSGQVYAQEHGIALSVDAGGNRSASFAANAGYFRGGEETRWSQSIALGVWAIECPMGVVGEDVCPANGGAQLLLLGISRRTGPLYSSLQGGLAHWGEDGPGYRFTPVADASVGLGVFGKHHPRILAAIGGRTAFSLDYSVIYAKLSLSFTLRPYVPPER